MATEDHGKCIAVIMPYHNNLYDLLIILNKLGRTYLLTPRSFKKKTHLPPPIVAQKIYGTPRLGPITHAYNPLRLWRMIAPKTTHVMIKHLDQVENIIPALIAHIRGARLIVMVQQVHLSFPRSLIIHVVAWYLRRTKAATFSVTQEGYETAKPLLPTIAYIPASIDPARFKLAELHHELPHTLRILAVGKYIRRKNFVILIEALSLVRKQLPSFPVSLTLIGPIGDQKVFNEITRHVEISPLVRNHVTVRTDVAPTDIPSILAEHALFILPATSEPLGYAILEAMAAGLPIITTADVGSASYVQQGKNGFILPIINPQIVAKTIALFSTTHQSVNGELLRQFGTHSRTLVEQFHTPNVIMKKIENVLA